MFKRLINLPVALVKKFPYFFLVALLGTMVGLVVLSNRYNLPEPDSDQQDSRVKQVEVYSVVQQPTLRVQGKVRKVGVVQILAQVPGVVSKIRVNEGDLVSQGETLLNLANNYQGGSAADLQAQLAYAQYENVLDTYDQQIKVIDQQKRAAELNKENSVQMRDLYNKAAEDTRGVIDLNNSILDQINDNLKELENNNSNGQNDDLILQTKQIKAQIESGLLQLKSSLRTNEYQASEDKPPADLADIQMQIALNQLELQKKGVDLSKKSSYLQWRLAEVNAANMNPSSPIAGTVEYVHVRKDDYVSPGTPLMTISGSNQEIELVAMVPDRIARQVSRLEPSDIKIENFDWAYYDIDLNVEDLKKGGDSSSNRCLSQNDGTASCMLIPDWVSEEGVNGQLYSIVYTLPTEMKSSLTDGEYLTIDIPLEIRRRDGELPVIPLDTVYQTQTQSYVMVIGDDKETAESREVKLGEIAGSYVYVLEGLKISDQVITDRGVLSGDKVSLK